VTDDPLAEEHASLQRAVAASRRTPIAAVETQFVRAMQTVMDDYRQARADGLTRDQAIPGIELVLRSVWGKKPSKFGPTCDACEDTGWRRHSCWADLRCGRPFCAAAHPSHEHGYVSPCACAKGDLRSGRGRAAAMDDVSEAMKVRTPKKRGFSRFGQ
jgi:hypothetical protein